MAAVVDIQRQTGAGPTPTDTDITSINTRANAVDSHTTADTANPIQIPSAGTNYSYWVSTRLNVKSGLSGTIDNLRWFSDGANGLGTGVTAKGADAATGADAGYRQATGTPGVTGTQLTTGNHTGLDGAPIDVFGHTSGSPKALGGSITATTGKFGDHFVYQIEVAPTAGPGATAAETFTWRYDET